MALNLLLLLALGRGSQPKFMVFEMQNSPAATKGSNRPPSYPTATRAPEWCGKRILKLRTGLPNLPNFLPAGFLPSVKTPSVQVSIEEIFTYLRASEIKEPPRVFSPSWSRLICYNDLKGGTITEPHNIRVISVYRELVVCLFNWFGIGGWSFRHHQN